MGLLDEAIREHLELKRRSGADPGEVAREEREALTPVVTDERTEPDDEMREPVHHDGEQEQVTEAHAVDWEDDPPARAIVGDPSTVAQETAELDMQAVMEEDLDAANGGAPAGPIESDPVPASPAGELPAEESLDWEFPGEADGEATPQDIPGQERLSFE